MADLTIPLHGMSQAESRVNTAASRIARMGSRSSGSEDSIDLGVEMVALIQSKNAYTANVNVAQALEQMNGSLLSILA
jgi:flagellar basal body rod protein FlgG